MPNPERGLVTQLLDNEEASELVSEIQGKWFADFDCETAFEIIEEHVQEFGEPMSRQLFLEDMPGFPFENYDVDTRALIKRIRTKHARLQLADLNDHAAASAKVDVLEALDTQVAELNTLRAEIAPKDDANVAESMQTAVDRYVERRDNKGTLGLRWMWEPLQRVMQTGAKKGGYYLLYARPKQGKTWIWLAQCVQWYYNNHVRLLVISRELTVEQMQDRILCLFAEVDYARFVAGELTPAEEILIQEGAEAMEEIPHLYVESVQGYGAAAARAVDALCEKYGIEEGDVCFVDGIYFYAEDSDWKSLGAFSRGLADVKRVRKCTMMATQQANRSMKNTANSDAGAEMAMGDAPSQDTDGTLKVRLDGREEHAHVMLVEARDARRTEFTIHFKPATDFSVKYSDAPGEDEDVETSATTKRAPRVGTKKRVLRLGGKGKPEVQEAS